MTRVKERSHEQLVCTHSIANHILLCLRYVLLYSNCPKGRAAKDGAAGGHGAQAQQQGPRPAVREGEARWQGGSFQGRMDRVQVRWCGTVGPEK